MKCRMVEVFLGCIYDNFQVIELINCWSVVVGLRVVVYIVVELSVVVIGSRCGFVSCEVVSMCSTIVFVVAHLIVVWLLIVVVVFVVQHQGGRFLTQLSAVVLYNEVWYLTGSSCSGGLLIEALAHGKINSVFVTKEKGPTRVMRRKS